MIPNLLRRICWTCSDNFTSLIAVHSSGLAYIEVPGWHGAETERIAVHPENELTRPGVQFEEVTFAAAAVVVVVIDDAALLHLRHVLNL